VFFDACPWEFVIESGNPRFEILFAYFLWIPAFAGMTIGEGCSECQMTPLPNFPGFIASVL